MDNATLVEVIHYADTHTGRELWDWLNSKLYCHDYDPTCSGEILDSDTVYKLNKYMKLKEKGLDISEINFILNDMRS